MDDEPLLSEAICDALSDHTVRAALDARKALALITEGERYDLILCDLSMPHLSGVELHERLHAIAPEQAERMVFMSGGALSEPSRAALARLPNPRLEKPFDLDALLRLIERRLG